MNSFDGKVAVITGGGCGIGRSLAEQLAPMGCNLALVDISQERLDEAAAACAQDGVKVTTHIADVRDRDSMGSLAEEVVKAHGGVHILINNAGVTAWASFEEMSFEDIDWVLDVNLQGVINGCKFFLPHMRKESEAHIVNVSSLFGILGVRNQAAYCMSKYAVRGLTEALDIELDETPINVSVIHPGGVATNFITDSRGSEKESVNNLAEMMAKYSIKPEKVAEKIITAIRKNKLRMVVGPDAVLGDWLKRALPVRGQRLMARFLKKSMP